MWKPASRPLLFLFLLLPCNFPSSVHASSSTEVPALMELKASIDPDGEVLTSWTVAGDPCSGDFEGVACNVHGKVVNVTLQGKGLSGSIPPAVAGLHYLSGLFLHYNGLSGEIPKEIGNLTALTELYLDVNNLTGGIPPEMGNMASLQVLQLSNNKLTGSIPNQLGLLKKLTVLSFQSNHLSGAIPASLADISDLSRLDLSYNQLFGSIPVRLARLQQLQVLDVRNNSLSGNVPPELKSLDAGFRYGNNVGLCGSGFAGLRLCSSTDLLGPKRPEPYGPADGDSSTAGGAGFQGRQIPQSAEVPAVCNGSTCQPKPSASSSSSTSRPTPLPLIAGVAIIASGIMAFSLVGFVWMRRRKQKIGASVDSPPDRRHSTDQAAAAKEVSPFYRRSAGSPLAALDCSRTGWDPLAAGAGGSSGNGGFCDDDTTSTQCHRFNLEEVEYATQHFSDVNLLARNSFVATHRGILRDGSVVAVKTISKNSCKAEEADFLKGLKLLTSLRHDNLVVLRGFCCSRGRGECFLVYDFVANGSLAGYLDVKKGDENRRALEWGARVGIIKGIAKGIEYLHANKPNKPPLVHQNISAENILLDHHSKPLLLGSGLHKLLADDVIYSSFKASAAMGYLAPEYTTTGRFSVKSDVYAFGVIVFQLLTGKKRTCPATRLGMESSSKVEDLIDENLAIGSYSKAEAARLAGIALACTSESPDKRPTMEAVLKEINSGRS